ncbi:hypothetical protein RBG61_01635 [Paludicola sp. MB14-C6]|uniref:hypothetical protein n=1 Tax=Paludihabitans sp. MB14-C6 TaxID=3070656 RepID=UPI0027DE13E0|nr:hypothetical protein [Paludicola sp. MB14-C6]WMJ23392.1 hypothetical protein RBG61_01635 [Paludicola sp. MB14-C6]
MDIQENVANNEQFTIESKKIHIPSLVLMIIGAVFALVLPIITYPCSITSLVMSIVKRKTNKTTYAIVINIISLVVALINSVVGAIMFISLN